jgi:hypothetical protein
LAALASRNSWSTSLASIPSSRDRSNASCTLSRKKIQSNSVLHKCYNKWNQFGTLIMALSIIMRMVLLWKWNTSMSCLHFHGGWWTGLFLAGHQQHSTTTQ